LVTDAAEAAVLWAVLAEAGLSELSETAAASAAAPARAARTAVRRPEDLDGWVTGFPSIDDVAPPPG